LPEEVGQSADMSRVGTGPHVPRRHPGRSAWPSGGRGWSRRDWNCSGPPGYARTSIRAVIDASALG